MYVYIIYMIHHDSICLALERPAVQLHLIKHSIAPWSLLHRHSSAHVEGTHDGLMKADKFKEAKSCLVSKGAKTCSTRFRTEAAASNCFAAAGGSNWGLQVTTVGDTGRSKRCKHCAFFLTEELRTPVWAERLMSRFTFLHSKPYWRLNLWRQVGLLCLDHQPPCRSILPVNIAGAQRIPLCQWKQPRVANPRKLCILG